MELQVFKNSEFGEIRTIVKNGEPWFIGKDVAEILGYSNTRKALGDHIDEDDKGVTKCDTPGGKQSLVIINESGLYSLILSSKLEMSKKFKKWVTSEVLPTIRKTGGYVAENRAIDFVSTWLPSLDDTSKNAIAGMLEENRKLIIKNEKLEKDIEYKEDVLIGLTKNIDLSEKRQVLNQVVRYKGADFQGRWKLLYDEFQRKYHMDLKRRKTKFDKENKPKSKSTVDFIDRSLGMVPELYEIACKLFEGDVNDIINNYRRVI
jgi:prophage antirepressor-like protein